MRKKIEENSNLAAENKELKIRLEEAEETLRAIRHGEIDAVIVKGKDGNHVYTLKGAEYTYRMLIESMNEGAVTFDKNGTIVYANKSFAKMVGLPLEKVIGVPVNSFIAVKDLGIFEIFLQKSKKRVNTKKEAHLKTIDGKLIPVLFSVTPLQLDDDQFGLSMIITDLTEQKAKDDAIVAKKITASNLLHEQQARKNAEESEEKFRQLADSMPQIVWTAKPNGYVDYYNKKWYEYTGFKEAYGEKSWRPILHPDDIKKTIELFMDSIKTSKLFQIEYRFKDKKHPGTYRWFLGKALPVKDKTGKIIKWFGTSTDIDDQKRTEEALRQSQLQFKALFDSDIIGVIVADVNGKIYEANDVFLKMIGYRKYEVLNGKIDWHDLTPDGSKELEAQVSQQMLEKGSATPWEKEYIRKDGKRISALVTGAMIDIEKRLAVSLILDITERKRLEIQKDEFIGIASHELKTPVTSLKAYAQVLRYKFLKSGDATSAGQLSKMDAQLNKLTALIGDLLDVTKIEAGKLHFNEEYFNFDETVKEVTDQMQLTTERHMIDLKCQTKKKVYGDRDRLSQVMTNLISNAIKYSPHTGRIIIEGSIEKECVKLCVQDFGIGMSKIAQEKVFERFFRVSGPNNQTFPGLGLGLYISSEIIKRQGGRIWVESVKGKGSTFCFILPFRKRKINKQPAKIITDEELKHE